MEVTVQMKSYDLITNTETWWDKSRDWNTPTDSYKLFRRDRQEGGAGNLPSMDWLHKPVFEKQQWTSQELVAENQRPSRQRKPHGLCLLPATQLRGACWQNLLTSPAGGITLAGSDPAARTCQDSHHDICWKSSSARCKQSRRLLESIKDNFLTQVTEKRYCTCCLLTQIN